MNSMHPLKVILQDGWIHDCFSNRKPDAGCYKLCTNVTHCCVTSKERMLGRLTSRKRPPKMYRLSGRLREVVAYKNRTLRGLFREEVEAHLLYGR